MAYGWHLSGHALWLGLRPFTDAVIMLIILGFAPLWYSTPVHYSLDLAARWYGLLSALLLFAKHLSLPVR